jgi:glycogen debranching enzyme
MDTNYPACTPREGYAVEIQALWVRLLRLLGRIGTTARRTEWNNLAGKAQASIEHLFWMEEKGYYSDVLQARQGEPAAKGVADDALRSNGLFLVSLGISSGERARRTTESAIRYLIIPGALRSLAPLEVKTPLRLCSSTGQTLNNPMAPYWGRYEGDEDTRRKPAYHNGTAWVWTLPTLCEALAIAWNFSAEATAAARAYLSSTSTLLSEGCLGHLPEILDGDAPHLQRGCDAQAWSATETLRVLRLLQERQGS